LAGRVAWWMVCTPKAKKNVCVSSSVGENGMRRIVRCQERSLALDLTKLELRFISYKIRLPVSFCVTGMREN